MNNDFCACTLHVPLCTASALYSTTNEKLPQVLHFTIEKEPTYRSSRTKHENNANITPETASASVKQQLIRIVMIVESESLRLGLGIHFQSILKGIANFSQCCNSLSVFSERKNQKFVYTLSVLPIRKCRVVFVTGRFRLLILLLHLPVSCSKAL